MFLPAVSRRSPKRQSWLMRSLLPKQIRLTLEVTTFQALVAQFFTVFTSKWQAICGVAVCACVALCCLSEAVLFIARHVI